MKSTFFQTILIIVFIAFAIFAALVFSGFIPIGGDEDKGPKGEVVIWGTLPADGVNPSLDKINLQNQGLKVSYIEKDDDRFEQDLIEALASQKGPDLIFFPETFIVRHGDKLLPLGYNIISERDFKSSFVEEAELLLLPTGIIGVPFFIDPIILYYNRDTYNEVGFTEPVSKWIDFPSVVPKLSKLDKNNNVLRSGIPLGEYDNVLHAKEILSLLMFQLGSPIVALQYEKQEDGMLRQKLVASMNRGTARLVNPGESALRFYTEFANPTKTTYSWNKTMPNSKDAFVSGRAAMYLGFSSEAGEIAAKNPLLNFDVAVVPQLTNDYAIRATYGKMYSLGVVKLTKNLEGAVYVATGLFGRDFGHEVGKSLFLAPARRDALSLGTSSDAMTSIFYRSALIAKGFLDPSPKETAKIFRQSVSDILSGKANPAEAAGNAHSLLSDVLQKD